MEGLNIKVHLKVAASKYLLAGLVGAAITGFCFVAFRLYEATSERNTAVAKAYEAAAACRQLKDLKDDIPRLVSELHDNGLSFDDAQEHLHTFMCTPGGNAELTRQLVKTAAISSK